MSAENSDVRFGPTTDTVDAAAPTQCASYMGCRHCEEGALVYDRDAGASRCRSCGKLD